MSPQAEDRTTVDRFRPYITDVANKFKDDKRVLWWEGMGYCYCIAPCMPWEHMTQCRTEACRVVSEYSTNTILVQLREHISRLTMIPAIHTNTFHGTVSLFFVPLEKNYQLHIAIGLRSVSGRGSWGWVCVCGGGRDSEKIDQILSKTFL